MVVRLFDFQEGSWVVVAGLEHSAVGVQYKYALYKALSQMVVLGHGERGARDAPVDPEGPEGPWSGSAPIVATTCYEKAPWCEAEQWMTLIGLYVGVAFQSVLISQISTILVEMSGAKQHFREEMRHVNEYMRHRMLPPEIRDRVREYYGLQFRDGKIFEEKLILSKLSFALRSEILRYNSRELQTIVPLLRNGGESAFRTMSQFLEASILSPHDDAVHEGDTIPSDAHRARMWFILSGTAEVLSQTLNLTDHLTVHAPSVPELAPPSTRGSHKPLPASTRHLGASSLLGSGRPERPVTPSQARRPSTPSRGSELYKTRRASVAARAKAENFKNQKVLSLIGDGCYFGEVALLLSSATGSARKRCATVHARTALVCYTISESDLRHTLRDLPGVSEYVHLIARRRLERVERLSELADSAYSDPELMELAGVLSRDENQDEEDRQTAFWKGHYGLGAAARAPKDFIPIDRPEEQLAGSAPKKLRGATSAKTPKYFSQGLAKLHESAQGKSQNRVQPEPATAAPPHTPGATTGTDACIIES